MSINKKEKEMLYIYKTIIFQERRNDFKKEKEMLYNNRISRKRILT